VHKYFAYQFGNPFLRGNNLSESTEPKWQIQFVRAKTINGTEMVEIICNKLQIKSKRNIKHPPRCLDSSDSKYLQICQLHK